jgi:cell division protein FtsL
MWRKDLIMKSDIIYCLLFGIMAFLLVLQSKFSNDLAVEIEHKKDEIRIVEKEISELKSQINSMFSSQKIKVFAEDTLKMKLTDPTNIINIENKGGNYSIKGDNHNIVEQVMTSWSSL